MKGMMRSLGALALLGAGADMTLSPTPKVERSQIAPIGPGRALHLHAPKGRRHRSLKERSNRRKAARKARNRR